MPLQIWNTYMNDEKEGLCCACPTEIHQNNFDSLHFIALCNGGTTTLDNLRPCCNSCSNNIKDKNFLEFKDILRIQRQQVEIQNKAPSQKISWNDQLIRNQFINYLFTLGNHVDIRIADYPKSTTTKQISFNIWTAFSFFFMMQKLSMISFLLQMYKWLNGWVKQNLLLSIYYIRVPAKK